MRRLLTHALGFLVAMTLATPGKTDVLTYQQTFDSGWEGRTIMVDMPQFDPIYGVLNSISLTVDQRSSVTYAIDNDTVYDSYAASVELATYHVAMASSYTEHVYAIIHADDGDGPGLQSGGLDYVTGTVGFDWLNQQSLFWDTDLETAIGTGTLAFPSVPVGETFGFYLTESAVLDRMYEQRMTLHYDYTSENEAVPEPGTLMLLTCGLGIGLLRRVRRN